MHLIHVDDVDQVIAGIHRVARRKQFHGQLPLLREMTRNALLYVNSGRHLWQIDGDTPTFLGGVTTPKEPRLRVNLAGSSRPGRWARCWSNLKHRVKLYRGGR